MLAAGSHLSGLYLVPLLRPVSFNLVVTLGPQVRKVRHGEGLSHAKGPGCLVKREMLLPQVIYYPGGPQGTWNADGEASVPEPVWNVCRRVDRATQGPGTSISLGQGHKEWVLRLLPPKGPVFLTLSQQTGMVNAGPVVGRALRSTAAPRAAWVGSGQGLSAG